jgi:hypothetical protein
MLATILPILLLVLICPIVMVFMMRGMHGHGSHNVPQETVQGEVADSEAVWSQSTVGRKTDDALSVAELRALRDDLEMRLDQIHTRIDELETPRAPATPTKALNA